MFLPKLKTTRPANTPMDSPVLGGGLFAGTLVETEQGWKPVETILQGEAIYTFDGGLKPVRTVTRRRINTAQHVVFRAPGGSLGNCDDILLLAQQMVLVDLPGAEEMFGTPCVLVPAAALEGFRGVVRSMRHRATQVVTLSFDEEEIVFANTGIMVYCTADKLEHLAMPRSEFFTQLDFLQTRHLLGQQDGMFRRGFAAA